MVRLILSMTLMLLSAICFGSDSKTLTAAANPWPPFVDPGNPKEGLSLEVLRAAFETQGYKVKMIYQPWARAMNNVKVGKVDILPDVWLNEERKKDYYFSDSYAQNAIRFIKRSDDEFEFNGIESLFGKKVGIVRGYSYADEFMKNPKIEKPMNNNFISNIKKLIAKRIDLTIEDEIVARMLLAQESNTLVQKIGFTKNAISIKKLYLATGKKNPRGKEIVDTFNKGIKVIKSNKVYSNIMMKYGIKE